MGPHGDVCSTGSLTLLRRLLGEMDVLFCFPGFLFGCGRIYLLGHMVTARRQEQAGPATGRGKAALSLPGSVPASLPAAQSARTCH